MRDGTRAFFQIQGIFHYFRAFKTEILHIYSLTGQILKQLSPSVSMTSVRYLSPLRGIIVNYPTHALSSVVEVACPDSGTGEGRLQLLGKVSQKCPELDCKTDRHSRGS